MEFLYRVKLKNILLINCVNYENKKMETPQINRVDSTRGGERMVGALNCLRFQIFLRQYRAWSG